jgi:hypothetical protein
MATENPLQIVSREAGTNVTNKRCVVEAGINIVNRASTEGQRIDGVVAYKSLPLNAATQTITSGDPAPICKSGTVIVESGGDVAANAEVMTDSVGRAITHDATAPTKFSFGVNRGKAVVGAGKDLSIELWAHAQTPGVTP